MPAAAGMPPGEMMNAPSPREPPLVAVTASTPSTHDDPLARPTLPTGLPATTAIAASSLGSGISPLDPILDLCPSITSLQVLIQRARQTPERTPEILRRLTRALLRAATNGDVELLAWILHPAIQAKRGHQQRPLPASQLPSPSPRASTAMPPQGRPDAAPPPSADQVRAFEAELLAQVDVRAARDDEGTGPMVLAASAGHVDALKMLVQAGADVDERDACGWTPLMWATNTSNAPLVGYLLSHGADPETRSHKGISCEDFILSSTPEAGIHISQVAGPSRLSLNLGVGSADAHAGKNSIPSPTRIDRELIADMIYDHQQLIARERIAAAPIPPASAPFAVASVSSSPAAGTPGRRRAHGSGPAPGLRNAMAESYADLGGLHRRSAHDGSAALKGSPVPAHDTGYSTPGRSAPAHPEGVAWGHSRTPSSARRLLGRDERVLLAEAGLRARELAEGRRRALLDVAILLEVNYENLLGDPPNPAQQERASWAERKSRKRRAARKGGDALGPPRTIHHDLSSGCGAAEVGADVLSVEFDWDMVRPEQMLVLGAGDASLLLDTVVDDVRAIRAPWTSRAAPANILFLAVRYACSVEDEELLEELILGTVDRIEAQAYAKPTDMTLLAFWLYNCTLLLHYAHRDRTLRLAEGMEEYRLLLADLVNELYVFIVRDIERRIDRVLDAAMLDHDAIPGMEDVRFESEWKFIKTLTGSVKHLSQSSNAAMSGSGAGASHASGSGSLGSSSSPSAHVRRPISQIFSRTREATPEPASVGGVGADATQRMQASASAAGAPSAPRSPPNARADSPMRQSLSAATGSSHPDSPRRSTEPSASDLLAKPTPRTITSLLTSALHVLQLYEVNPAIIVQALSQVFFWVGCELFNRVLLRKRYLCRSRAMQVRMNVSALEDWARSNALPLSIVAAHLSPVTQLLSWVQCQSTLVEFDGLIATMQGLRSLNPLQMRRVVRDYRYEVGEGRMSEECLQYLDQVQKEWRRRRDETLEAAREREQELREAKARMASLRNSKAQQHHQRSGTATQRDPGGGGLDEYDDEEVGGSSTANTTAGSLGGGGSVGGKDDDEHTLDSSRHTVVEGAGSSVAASDEIKTSSEEVAARAQEAIDSLFTPGRGMADYVPPWSASGAPPGLTKEVVAEGTVPGELLNSRDMLPFALPTRTEALIVSPGDAFGFGRGHFQGTGTPSLKSVRAEGPNLHNLVGSPRVGGGGRSTFEHSRPTSPSLGSEASDGRSAAADSENGGHAPSSSAASGATQSSLASSRASSSLYPTGKGFAAGAYWQPVPLVADETLEAIDAALTQVRPQLERRLNSILDKANALSTGNATHGSDATQPPPSPAGATVRRSSSRGAGRDTIRGAPNSARDSKKRNAVPGGSSSASPTTAPLSPPPATQGRRTNGDAAGASVSRNSLPPVPPLPHQSPRVGSGGSADAPGGGGVERISRSTQPVGVVAPNGKKHHPHHRRKPSGYSPPPSKSRASS